jgi:hypothetical protein
VPLHCVGVALALRWRCVSLHLERPHLCSNVKRRGAELRGRADDSCRGIPAIKTNIRGSHGKLPGFGGMIWSGTGGSSRSTGRSASVLHVYVFILFRVTFFSFPSPRPDCESGEDGRPMLKPRYKPSTHASSCTSKEVECSKRIPNQLQ